MKKFILGLVAAAAIATPLVGATAAHAATTAAPNASTVFLSKSTLQGTLHLNNAGFDALKASDFTATGTAQDRPARALRLQRRAGLDYVLGPTAYVDTSRPSRFATAGTPRSPATT